MMPQLKMEPKNYGFMNWWELIESRAIRNDIMTRPDLSRAARDLFAFLMRAQKTLKFIIFGIKYMSTELHYHPRTVQRAIKQLVDAGLLMVEYRMSPKHDPTLNRYFPRWSPYEVPSSRQPSTETKPNFKRISTDSQALSATTPESLQNSLTPGRALTVCRDPLSNTQPEPLEPQAIVTPSPKPILDPLLRKKDQPGPALRQRSHVIENTPDQLKCDDVFISIPTDWNIYTPRLAQWIGKFGVTRVKTVIQWVENAPKGTIRHPGGWIYRALTEDWSEPTWEGDSVKRTQSALVRKQQVDEEMSKREQEEEERQAAGAAFEQAWSTVAPLIDQPLGKKLLQRAYDLAAIELKSMTNTLFKAGSPLWKSFVIRAWEEL